MKKYWYWNEKDAMQNMNAVLQHGGIIAGSSDTIIGLLAPLSQEGKEALDRIKKREQKPYIILVRDMHHAAQFSQAIARAQLQPLLKACWPGPLTVIVPANAAIPDYIASAGRTIALRVPDHPGLQKLLQTHDGFFSTSANLTGQAVPDSVKGIDPEIIDQVALLIDDREGKQSKPSTIIDATGQEIRLVREGTYPKELLQKYVAIVE